MKHVITLSESVELELLKNMLEEGGIHCVIKNQELAQAMPITPFNAELWVLDDENLFRAQQLCNDWFAPDFDATNIWTCSQCGQQLGARFDSCWKCGTPRDAAVSPNKKGSIIL